MKETEQTLLDKIKNDVAKENGFGKWTDIVQNVPDDHEFKYWPIVCERYAAAKAKARMAWIKATERLPQHMVQVSLKISGMPYSGRYDYSLKRFICPNMGPSGLPIDDVEWLDESCEVFTREQVQASCEATLKKASEKAVVRGYCAGCERAGLLHCAHADSCGSNVVIVDKSSINHPSNIVIV